MLMDKIFWIVWSITAFIGWSWLCWYFGREYGNAFRRCKRYYYLKTKRILQGRYSNSPPGGITVK